MKLTPVFIDFETYWDKEHTLKKLSPIEYVTSPKTQVISCAIKVGKAPAEVIFGAKNIKERFDTIDWNGSYAIAHNMSGFDSMLLTWRFGVKPAMYGCTLSMARPLHAKTTGLSLGALVEHYGLGVKDSAALVNTQGKRLEEFTDAEREAMARYNMADVEQCAALFRVLMKHFTPAELWHIDATVRMLVQPRFHLDVGLLEAAASIERDRKRKAILSVARKLRELGHLGSLEGLSEIDDVEEVVRQELASSPKFAALLQALGVEVPMKTSQTTGKPTPALSKTDEEFLALRAHPNEVVAAAVNARLAVKSTILESRIEAFIRTAKCVGGRMPVPLNYCGADTTGRWSGGMGLNMQNMPRVDAKDAANPANALRKALRAPKGKKVVVADLSGIELRVNHFLWQVASSMELYRRDPQADLYRAFAAARYGIEPEAVTKDQRQLAKVAQLGLGYGAGWRTFRRVAKLMGGLELTDEEAEEVTSAWRSQYSEIVQGWRACHDALRYVYEGVERAIDPWGLCVTCEDGIRLPSGRIIRYPGLREEETGDGKTEWVYGSGRHKARIYAGKVDENVVQALSRDIIADHALAFFKETKLRPSLMVHDELVYVVPQSDAEAVLETLQAIMRAPPAWWPDLVTWSEGDLADTYGDAK